ncbi:hypothetical protein SDJN03_01740, partial [Cucurbita argyrosperma subsp. sororia]
MLQGMKHKPFNRNQASSSSNFMVSVPSLIPYAKLIAYGFAVQTQAFSLHLPNGGLMQTLWLWRKMSRKRNQPNEHSSFIDEKHDYSVIVRPCEPDIAPRDNAG